MANPSDLATSASLDRLADLARRAGQVVALTGAGVSTESGIPAYRDDEGHWTGRRPIHHAEFTGREDARRRYWARSFTAWPAFAAARPNSAHHALAALERAGSLAHVVTQNVDGLHHRAGSRAVTDLHGRLDEVVCLECGEVSLRNVFQARLAAANETFEPAVSAPRPDGDAEIDDRDVATFVVPSCLSCGGVVKPRVVFFGGNVPGPIVAATYARIAEAAFVLVAGTSLEIFSGRRFVDAAAARGIPIAIVNRGTTRCDLHAAVRLLPRPRERLPRRRGRLRHDYRRNGPRALRRRLR